MKLPQPMELNSGMDHRSYGAPSCEKGVGEIVTPSLGCAKPQAGALFSRTGAPRGRPVAAVQFFFAEFSQGVRRADSVH